VLAMWSEYSSNVWREFIQYGGERERGRPLVTRSPQGTGVLVTIVTDDEWSVFPSQFGRQLALLSLPQCLFESCTGPLLQGVALRIAYMTWMDYPS
jgi:hypothetical protein